MSKEVFANDMLPGDLIHPAEILKDELEARSLSQTDFVKMTSLKKSFVSLLLKGERNITLPVALEIEKALNIKAEFWIRLQKSYELNKLLKSITAIRKTNFIAA